MEIYCNNCGIKGHVYKQCKNPIMSYGNIIFKEENGEYKVLMINRKDSICYIELLRGKYDITNINYIQILINKITTAEKEKLIQNDYDTLWKRLWLIDTIGDSKLKKDYLIGKDKFMKLQSGFFSPKINETVSLNYFIQRSNTNYIETEWEFPKGRRNKHEKNRDCAIREFNEETNYTEKDYELIQNVIPFSEEFNGENKVRYKYIYYLGYLTNYEKECKIDPENVNQLNEIQNILWLGKEQAKLKLREYHHTRYKLIDDIFRLLDNIDKKYKIIQ
tara:strand:- start:1226 stop:2053 length:828 start_codon:yes stop_codon:yes gene_type:complete